MKVFHTLKKRIVSVYRSVRDRVNVKVSGVICSGSGFVFWFSYGIFDNSNGTCLYFCHNT